MRIHVNKESDSSGLKEKQLLLSTHSFGTHCTFQWKIVSYYWSSLVRVDLAFHYELNKSFSDDLELLLEPTGHSFLC